MSDREELLELAARLADGEDVGSSGLPEHNKFQLLAELSTAYRSVRGEDDGGSQDHREVLFRWGHLQVLEMLGEGGFGEVFRAYDPVLDRDVALKLRRQGHESAADSRTFLHEARRLARVRHANVLAVHGASIEDGRAGLWADLIGGKTLEQIYEEDGVIDSKTACAVASDIASALSAVHQAGLVHGDVKPSNVMMHNGQYILMDFGAGSEFVGRSSGPIAGTPLSMAPELFGDGPISTHSDQYALGVMLFRLLSGEYPIAAGSVAELKEAHQEGAVRSLRHLSPHLPRGLVDLVHSLLSFRPEDRPTASEVGEKIAWLLEAPKRRARTRIIGALLFALTLGTIALSVGYLTATRSEAIALSSQRETEVVNQFLNDMLHSVNTTQGGREVRVLDVLEQASSGIDRLVDSPVIQATLLHTLGRSYSTLYELGRAEELLTRSYQLRKEHLGESHFETLNTRSELGLLLDKRGADQLSRDVLEETLDLMTRHHGSELIEIARVKVSLGSALVDLNAYKEAETLLEAATALLAGTEGRDRRYYCRALLATTNLYQRQSRYDEAQAVADQALACFLSSYGGESGNSLVARGSLANALARQGKFAEAEAEFKENLSAGRSITGDNHGVELAATVGLANVLREQGRYEEALPLAERALELSTALMGQFHENTIAVRGNIATVRTALGDLSGAESDMRSVISDIHQHLGDTHPGAFINEYNLAELLNDTGRYGEALKMAHGTYARKLKTLGETHHFTLESLDNIGVSLWGQGKLAESEVTLQKVLDQKSRSLGERSPHTLNTLSHLARTLADQGKREGAASAYQKLLSLRTEVLGESHPLTLEAKGALAELTLQK